MKVVKRNGDLENYDPEKIKRVVKSAGMPEEKADKLVDNVTAWVAKTGEQKVKSISLRDEITKQLKILDGRAADYFIWYQKSRDKNSH